MPTHVTTTDARLPRAKGMATLVLGTVTVSTSVVAANSVIMLARFNSGGILGHLQVSAINAGTSFTILSGSLLDTSVVAWAVYDP